MRVPASVVASSKARGLCCIDLAGCHDLRSWPVTLSGRLVVLAGSFALADNSFNVLSATHVQAAVEARRAGLPEHSDAYAAISGLLQNATALVNAAADDDASLAGAAAAAGRALDQMLALS